MTANPPGLHPVQPDLDGHQRKDLTGAARIAAAPRSSPTHPAALAPMSKYDRGAAEEPRLRAQWKAARSKARAGRRASRG